MKIAFINVYQDHTERGAEIYVKELSKRLQKNHEVKIYSSSQVIPKRWPILWRLFIDPQSLAIGMHTMALLPKLFMGKFDIIIPLNGGWQSAILRIFTWSTGAKLVISGQSGTGWDDRNNLWNFPDIFVALTKESSRWAKRANPFAKIEVIPNGVNLEKFTSKKRGLFTNLEKPIILTVGALESDKRQQLAIKAVARLKKGSLVIIGKGSEKRLLEKRCNKLLEGRYAIEHFGHEKMPEVYQSVDLFTYPTSPSESFGIVLIEAMACGLAVVATKDPIREEIIGNAGILVDPENSADYSRALKEALSKKWGKKPRAQAENYAWDTVAEKYEVLFSNIAKS